MPTAKDPMDPSFCTTLYSDKDEGKINPSHIEIRREVLEVHRTMTGRIFFQCAFCKHLPQNERKGSIYAPQRVENIYRANVRFMMGHVRSCKFISQRLRALDPKAKNKVPKANIRHHWIKSTHAMGLINGDHGIILCPEVNHTR